MPDRKTSPRASAAPILALATTLALASPSNSQVTLREGAYDWKTWDVAETANHGAGGQNLSRQVTRHFRTLVLENEYLVVTLLPEYGARILSIFYKPTGHEQLFQNPVGFADGIGAGSFYYNWLMVLGGIFPTFPEPEHGKTYLLPWKSEIVENTPARAAVAMSLTDDIDFPGHPGKFNLGVTGLTCVTTVSLEAGKAAVRMDVSLRNDKAQAVRYEYWTCHSLAPGSAPGDTRAPKSTEIVVPIERYSVGYGTGGIDRALNGGQEYKNLAFFRNWQAEGIAYAEPAVTKKWWGVLNHDNEEGIFRISSDPKQTPGLKFWTWGYHDSYPVNARARQFIELWAGAGHQFFSPVQMAARTTKSWSETYLPTVGLPGVSEANENALAFVKTDKTDYDGKSDAVFTYTADITVAAPGAPFRAVLTGSIDGTRVLLDSLIRPDAKSATHLKLALSLTRIGPGRQNLSLALSDAQGHPWLMVLTPVNVANVALGLASERKASLPGIPAPRLPRGLWNRFADPYGSVWKAGTSAMDVQGRWIGSAQPAAGVPVPLVSPPTSALP